ncbi:hypothetical protein ABL78_4938 [Leptomonas seymouri]|uniref:FHA domain-containing protein n=1 Tax=Leptomonas seymouri TaxID=5684 RepID=A0A0N1I2V4_LEPSE|nr:hypothetical protein ABL78_4938 [Leptomonas seymouri]|eukprot:KPI86005.1 hypothetical protein ABL78_4938 [Leptomonas seymouri]
MFAFELSTVVPCGSAPYYSLVIRDPYVIGNHSGADIAIAYEGVSAAHVSLTVLHAHDAEKELAAATRAAVGGATAAPTDDDNAEEPRHDEGQEEAYASRPAAATAGEDGEGQGDGAAAGGSSAEDDVVVNPSLREFADGEGASVEERAPAFRGDHLVVRVTALSTKGPGEIHIGNVSLQPGDSVIVRDGDVLVLGDGVSGTFRYRPLVVGLETDTYPADYVKDLRRMFHQLGATFVDRPIPSSELPHLPIGQLYCTEELNDSTNCLAAMAYGYSVVQPTYIFEWFAAVSTKASSPLNSLPSPSLFEVPVRCTMHPTTTTYLRPEPDTCPFALFPIPSTAVTNRSRAELFAGRVFFFFTDAAATRYWRAVEDCGGVVYGPGDVEAAKEAIRRLVEAQRDAGVSSQRLPNNFYIIIDNTSEAVLLNSGLEAASPELLAFMNEAGDAYGAVNLCVMGDHSLFIALLSNKFYEEPVPLTSEAPAAVPPMSDAAGRIAEGYHGAAGSVSARTPRSNYSPRYHSGGGGSGTARSASRKSEQRSTLLPRTTSPAPSHTQMRFCSRQRSRSMPVRSAQDDGASARYESGSYYSRGGSMSGRHGRRHLVPSLMEGELRSFVEDFDMVRVRIYAFLIREEPKLDKAITTYHRNLYVNIDTMEYTLGVKAQAEDFMERVDDLLADPSCHGAYTESLRRFWRDCSEIDVKAQHLLHFCDRHFPAAVMPRRSRSARRAGSIASRRALSSRGVTPRGAAATASPSAANSPAPVEGQGEHGNGISMEYLATAAASHPYSSDDTREHRELYISPEATTRLQEEGQAQEYSSTQQREQEVGAGTNGVALLSGARGYSASTRQSRRRSLTPRSRASHAGTSPRAVPIGQRPPWVEHWAAEPERTEEEENHTPATPAAEERPAWEAYRASLYTTPARSVGERKAPRAVQRSPSEKVAKYAPSIVRARSAGRSASRPRHPAAEQQRHAALHESLLSSGSMQLPAEMEDGFTSPLDSAKKQPETRQKKGAKSATRIAGQVHAGKAELEWEESQVRTVPTPTPQPGPVAPPHKAAAPSPRKPRSKSASATKRTTEQNGSVSNGRATGRSCSKPRSSPLWRY